MMSVSVCLSAWSHLQYYRPDLHQIFCACYVCLWLGLFWHCSLPCWTSYFEGSFTSWLLYWPCLTVSTKEQSGVFLVVLLKKSLMQLLQRVPSVLWHCWFGIRKNIQPVTIEWWGVGVVICLEQGADCLHMVQLMPLPPPNPVISCLI